MSCLQIADARGDHDERVERVQALMKRERVELSLVSNPTNFRYLTGIVSDFFISPTRPWFLLVPATGGPVAVVPDVGRGILGASPVKDIRTWPSPRPHDEGISLLLETMTEIGRTSSVLGAEIGPESRLGMPVADFDELRRALPRQWSVRDCSELFYEAREVKSEFEVDRIARACAAANDAFEGIGSFIGEGVTETEIARRFMSLGFDHGADGCPYLSLVRGRGGYEVPVIRSAGDLPIEAGDIVSIDAGFTVGGYFCDFNRNWLVGAGDNAAASEAYRILHHVTDLGIEAVRPGIRVSSVWKAMADELAHHGVVIGGERLGHGVGLDLTEPPSISQTNETEIRPGMTLAIEPGFVYGKSKLMIHEEIVAVGERANRLLTERAAPELPVI